MSISRLPKGLSTDANGSSGPLGEWGSPDPTKYHTYFNDFHAYDLADWIITTTEAGAGSATEAVANAVNGELVITNAAGAADLDFLQYKGGTSGTAVEPFLFVAGKKTWFKTRVKWSDVSAVDSVIGLQITDTTPLVVSDGVFFSKPVGSTIAINTTKDSTLTSATVTTASADDTYATLGFFYNGVDSIEAYYNEARVASIAVTNLPDDEELTISFGVMNNEAVADSMTVDYVLVSQER